ncbi:hypothetical protein C8Q79DRAFT_339726 [Trametes meyenii]|nr:hypothetical protein C8Q79DRAFT_339726 [Trametes meyenii]
MLHQDFEDGMYVDSPQSSSFPELHPVPPRLQTSSRSYTLEGAITPITPNPRVDNCGTLANPNGPHRSSSPPMGSLVAPSSRSPPAESSPMPIKAEPSPPPPSAPTPPPPVVQKRPRGRPRKNPPNARPSSPPPAVDYPFPQFPEPSSSSASSALRAEDAALPPMAHPVPTLTAGTPGASGPGAGKGAGAGASAMPGQAMFRLNMHREGSGEGADAPQPEKKKQPIMACLFCRERKIACGPPAPGGPRRCNQCTRRDLVCEYPKESRRGQHKRGTRAQRVEALASGAALPSTIKPKGKGRADVHVDTENLPDAGSGPSQPSPLTPLSPPPTERPSRSEKVVRAQEHDGKERSRSRAPARDGWDAPHAAARRAVHQQHKRRTVGQGPGPGLGPGSGMGGLSPSGDVGPPSSSAMARIVHGSELAMAGVHITRGMPGM